MANVRNREDALLDAYLSRYKNAQTGTVSEGQSKAKTAQQKGSALLNATDKTLPVLKNNYSDTLQNIVSGAGMENSLNNDVMQRSMNLAKAKFDAANDLHEQQKKAQEYADKQAQKLAEEQAKAAAKAAKSSGSQKKSSKKTSGSKDNSDAANDEEDAAAALERLGIGGEKSGTEKTDKKNTITNGKSSAEEQAARNASARAKYDGSKQEKSDQKYRAKQQEKQQAQNRKQVLAAKQNGQTGKTGSSYAERQNAAQGARSRAVTSSGKRVGSSYAAAGQAPTERERAAGQQVKKQTADALKKLQTDESYRTQLAAPGRKLTQSEINAVKQYGKNPGDLYKEYQDGNISLTEYNKQGQELARMNQKANLNGAGQGWQAFTSGLFTSVPLLQQADDAIQSLGGESYQKAIENGVVPDTLSVLQGYENQNKLAAAAGTMAGKGAQYAAFNSLMEGTLLAGAIGKVGGNVMGAASSIPVLGKLATPAAGEALGRILTGQTADTLLDTIPSLANDISLYNKQQRRIENGEQVDDALTPGQIGLNVLGNVAQNFAMNALPEIGGAVVNEIKNSRLARQMLDEQAQGVANGLNAENAGGFVDAYRGLQNGNYTTNNVDALNNSIAAFDYLDDTVPTLRQDLQTSDAPLDWATALQNQTIARDTVGFDGNGLTAAENLPIDNAAKLAQNEVTGGIANGANDLGGTVPTDISVLPDSSKSIEPQPGADGNQLFGAAGTGRETAETASNGARAAADGAADSADVGSWARAITGKDRRSSITRSVEELGQRIADGASREDVLQKADELAARIVKERNFTEDADIATTALREYLKNTPIRLDEQAAGDILYTSGLKNLAQYNIQNGTKFSTTTGLDYDVALQELGGMNVGVAGGDGVDALMDAVSKSKENPAIDEVFAGAYTEYVRDTLLDGAQGGGISDSGFGDWLEGQGLNADATSYVRRMYEREFDYNPWGSDYNPNVLSRVEESSAESAAVPMLERQPFAEEHPNTVGSKESDFPYTEVGGRGHTVYDIDNNTLTPENQNILGTNEPYTVQRVSHRERQEQADIIRQNEGLDATVSRVVQDADDGKFNAESMTLGGNALGELDAKLNAAQPNTQEYAKAATQSRMLRSKLRKGLTDTAQTLESAKQFTTPDKAVMHVEGVLGDAQENVIKKHPRQFAKAEKQIQNAVEESRKEANEMLGGAVEEQVRNAISQGGKNAQSKAGKQAANAAQNAAEEVPVEELWARSVARRTAGYAADSTTGKDPDEVFAKEIVDQLFNTAKESPVAQGKKISTKLSAEEKLNLALSAPDDYETVWNRAREIAKKRYGNNADMSDRLNAFFENVKEKGSIYSNKTVLGAFAENLKRRDSSFRQLAEDAAFGNDAAITSAAKKMADAVDVPSEYRKQFLQNAESVLRKSDQYASAAKNANDRAFRQALNRAGFTVSDIADASAFGNEVSPVMAAHQLMEVMNPPSDYRQTVFDNIYQYIKDNEGYQKSLSGADNRVLRRLVGNVDGGYSTVANKAAFGNGVRTTVNEFLDEIQAPPAFRDDMAKRLTDALNGNTKYQKAALTADNRVFNEAVRNVQERFEFAFPKLAGETDANKARILDELTDSITEYLGVDKEQAKTVVDNIQNAYDNALADGARKRLTQIFPDTSRTKNTPRDQFLEILRSGAYNDEYMGEAVKDLAASKFGVRMLSDEQVSQIKQLMESAETLPLNSKQRVDIENQVAEIAAGNMKATGWQKFDALRYFSMLFNGATNLRNAAGNVGQGTIALTKDAVNGIVQRTVNAVSKAAGGEGVDVTVGYVTPFTKSDRALLGSAFADAENSRWRQLIGTSENFQIAKAAQNTGRAFDSRVMQTLSQMSNATLEDADTYGTVGMLSVFKPLNEKNVLRKTAEFVQDGTQKMGENGFFGVSGLKNNYGRYLASYLKAHGATNEIFTATDDASKALLEQARDYAVKNALVNTYHEANKLTDFVGSIKRTAKDVPLLGTWIEGQLPFVKTPTNVGIQAFRYSPGGLVQGIAELGKTAVKGGDVNKAMDDFSAGLTGTALAGLGAYLWSTGHLVPSMTDEEKQEADLTGAQENSLQFEDENGKTHSFTINWLSTWSGPMMVGANLAKTFAERDNDPTDAVGKVLNACVSVLDPAIDSTYLSSLNTTIDQLGNAQTPGEKAAVVLTSGFGNYATQGIPTLSGQIARTVDPVRRSTYTGYTGAANDLAYYGKKAINKIPVLSKQSEPYIDVWGNEENNFSLASGTKPEDYAARAAYNLLSPGYYAESRNDDVSRFVDGLYQSTGNKNVLPKDSSLSERKISTYDENGNSTGDVRLTPQQKTEYDKTRGQTAYDIVDSLRQNDMFLQLPDDQQAELVQSAYAVAKTAGGVAAVGEGVSGVDSKAYKAYEQGGVQGAVNYMLAKNAVDVAKGNSDTMSGAQKWDAIRSTLDTDAAAEQFVLQQGEKSTANRIYSAAGSEGLVAYMDAYSAISAELEDGKSPSRADMSKALLNAGLDSGTLAETYLSAYNDDEKAAGVYGKYGAAAMEQWLRYYAEADLDGNGSITQKEAQATLDQMNLTAQLKAAYWQMTNKTWKQSKNPY